MNVKQLEQLGRLCMGDADVGDEELMH